MKVKQISILWMVSGAIIALNIILYLIKPGGDKLMAVISDTLPVVCSLIATYLLYTTVKAFKSKDYTKTAWLMIFLGVALDFIAEVLYGSQEILMGINMDEVNKSIADVFWIVSYPFTIIGLVMLLNGYFKTDFPKGKLLIYIVLIILFLVVSVFLVHLLLGPIVKDSETLLIDKVVYMIYPVSDILIISLSLMLLYLTSQFGGSLISLPWRLIAIAWGFMGVSDILYSYYSWNDTYNAGSMIDVGWNLGYLLLGLAGLYQKKLLTAVRGGK